MAGHAVTLSRTTIRSRTHRLIASRFPTVGIFDDLGATPGEIAAGIKLEGLTNPRQQVAAGRLSLLPSSAIVRGNGASIVMAAFTHANDDGGRFTDSRLGAWYAATELETAIEETLHHNERRLRASTGGFPAQIQMRELIADIAAELVDIRGQASIRAELYRPNDYSASQAFASSIRWPFAEAAERGIVYDSVRRASGTNVCLFDPRLLPCPTIQGAHFQYAWDNAGIASVVELRSVDR